LAQIAKLGSDFLIHKLVNNRIVSTVQERDPLFGTELVDDRNLLFSSCAGNGRVCVFVSYVCATSSQFTHWRGKLTRAMLMSVMLA
jgi:hypothetical protein